MTSARARRLPKAWQEIAHVFVLLAGWLLFIWLWWDVMQGRWDTGRFWWIVIGSMLVFPVVTLVWIYHNVSIYRRLGPRKALRAVAESYAADFNRRQIDADWGALRNARFVTISNDESRKVFRAGPALPETTPGRPT